MFNSINFSNSNEWESYPFPFSNEDSLNNSIISNNLNLFNTSENLALFPDFDNPSLFEEIIEMQNMNLPNDTKELSSNRINFTVDKRDKKKKRGKQSQKRIKSEVHNNKGFDNLQRKIQVHFLSFVIDYSNDALRKEFKYIKDSFKNINKQNKITVNYDYVSKLKTLSIKDILKFDISEKYTKHKKSYNKDLLEEIEGKSIWLSKLFDMNYLDLFKIYYNKEKTKNKKNEEREEISTTKTKRPKYFYDLLEKYKNLRNNLTKTVKEVYFSENDNKNGSPFSTKAKS